MAKAQKSSSKSAPKAAPKSSAPFGGKKAAPFTSGGGRKQTHPNTAKGTPRKKASGK